MNIEALLSHMRLKKPIEKVSLEADLSGLDLNGVIFSEVDFSHCIIGDAKFGGAVLSNCNFSGCGLRKANLENAGFVECDLSAAYLDGKVLNNLSFMDCNLSGAVFSESKISQLRRIKEKFHIRIHNCPSLSG